jgi:hypothetical protein
MHVEREFFGKAKAMLSMRRSTLLRAFRARFRRVKQADLIALLR